LAQVLSFRRRLRYIVDIVIPPRRAIMSGFAKVFAAVALAAFLAPTCALNAEVSKKSTLSFDVEAAKERPVTKVITLLKEMLSQLEKEAADDEDIYDKLACWCTTNDKEKTSTISAAEEKIASLQTSIESLTASSARLNTEIKNLEAEVAANEDALAKATAQRQKELAEFNAEEKDSLETIAALKAAITVIGQHHSSLLQVPRSNIMGVAASVQHLLQKHSAILKGVLTHSERRAMASFIQGPQDFFDAAPTFKQSYAPESGEIYGILKQMKETFENNLSAAQKEEMKAQKDYEDIKAAKEGQIAAGKNQVDKKTLELADTDAKNAQAEEDLADTKSSLSADEAFLLALKEKCAATDAEWDARQKTRQMEMEAVSKAIAILSGDDAHDVFTKTFNPALLQKETSLNSQRRSEASKVLSAVAKKVGSPRLSAMAMSVRLDAFVKVKKAIDDMIAALMKEKADEIVKKDFCVDAFNENTKKTTKANRDMEDTESLIEALELEIEKLTTEIAALKADIADVQKAVKEASEARDAEHKEFQATVADQRETQKVLASALDVLKGFYAKAAAALVQTGQPAGPPPPPGFEAYENNANSGNVMELLQSIIDDTKSMEAETTRDETESQAAYEAFVKDSNASIAAKTKEVVDKSEAKAKAEGELVEAKEKKDELTLDLEHLANTLAELKQDCDFTMENFELRQTARDEEVEALKQAKAILSGAKFMQMLKAGQL